MFTLLEKSFSSLLAEFFFTFPQFSINSLSPNFMFRKLYVSFKLKQTITKFDAT